MYGKDLKPEKASLSKEYLTRLKNMSFDYTAGFVFIKQDKHLSLVCVNGQRIG